MKTTEIITFVRSPDHDWVQVYLGDKCIVRGHSFNVEEMLKQLGLNVRSMHVTQEYAEGGSWPDDFSEFPHEVLRYGG